MAEPEALIDLDFTIPAGKVPAPAPDTLTPEQHENALIGARSLESRGYHVVIARPAERQPQGGGHRVLIVEDDDDTAALSARALENGGYITHRAKSARDAGQVLARIGVPHLVLLDVELPENIDGFAMLAKFRAHPRLRDMPVVMFTSRAAVEDITRGLKLGANGYVVKPVKPATLRSAVDTVLKG